jgi:hypothetical protein
MTRRAIGVDGDPALRMNRSPYPDDEQDLA